MTNDNNATFRDIYFETASHCHWVSASRNRINHMIVSGATPEISPGPVEERSMVDVQLLVVIINLEAPSPEVWVNCMRANRTTVRYID